MRNLKNLFAYLLATLGWLLLIPIIRLWLLHRDNHINGLYHESPGSSIILFINLTMFVLFSLACYVGVKKALPDNTLTRLFFWPAAATILAEFALFGLWAIS